MTTTVSAYIDPLIGVSEAEAMSLGLSRPAYDAADLNSQELGLWAPPMQSADADLLPEKTIMDSRVRDIARNDAFIQNGTTIQKDHIVGEMFLLNSRPNYQALGLDEVWAEEFQEEVESEFTLYAESVKNYPDAARMNTLTALVRLAVGVFAFSGEVLASVEWMRNGYRPYSTALQMIDLDRLSNPNNEMDSRTLRRGVRRDKFGAPIGYYIRRQHPGDFMADDLYTWDYVPLTRGMVTGNPGWDRLQMIHIIEQWRPDQSRGVSSLVSALKELKMTKKFRDVVLQTAVLQSTYAASIESDLPADVALAQAGGGDYGAIANYGTAYLTEVAKYTGKARNIRVDGAKVPVFYPGTKMKLMNAGSPAGIGSDFEGSLLRYLAAALGVGTSELTKNFSEANYSNLKAELAQTGRRMRVQKKQVADRFASIFFRLWLEEALNKGRITSMPRNAPNWYEGLNADAYTQCSWIGASKGQIDELKETQAAMLRVRNGLSTWEDELARLGKDYRTVFKQLAREQKMMKDLELDFGTDATSQNTMNAAGGAAGDTGDAPRSDQ